MAHVQRRHGEQHHQHLQRVRRAWGLGVEVEVGDGGGGGVGVGVGGQRPSRFCFSQTATPPLQLLFTFALALIFAHALAFAPAFATSYGSDCTAFLEEGGQSGRILKDHPAIWTENEGGFQIWGDDPSHTSDYFWGRTARDLAFETLAWFARGGSHNNYYMYLGGANRGRWAGAGIMQVRS